jgi:hypothetical protein
MHRLLPVREEGEVEEKVVLLQLYNEVRKEVRHVSNVAGHWHQWCSLPFARLEDVAGQTKSAQNDQQADEPRSW